MASGLSLRSVFNFFPPSYVIPQSKLNAPEFDLENTATAILRLSLADSMVNNKITSFSIDLSAAQPAIIVYCASQIQMLTRLHASGPRGHRD